MRLHISLDDSLVHELDARIGARRRSTFIATAVRRALGGEQRWEAIDAALGAVESDGHGWDRDPAAWVREQRRADAGRVG